MIKECSSGISVSTVLVVVLGFMATDRMNSTIGAATQTTTDPNAESQESKPFDQKQAVNELRKKIAGKEDKPSEQVFKNIQIPNFKRLRARLLLGAMEFVFSRSLGVDCRYCHVVGQWEKDDMPTKQITREMYDMMLSIDGSLNKIRNLKSTGPIVSCYTCHRGQTKPEIELPEVKRRQE